MILYHGSYLAIVHPDLQHSRARVDFGKGFYTTPIYEQAEKWCQRMKTRHRPGIISVYEFDEGAYSELKVLSFEDYSEAWLDFILSCRREQDNSEYDLVIGGVANDKVFNTVELYFDGLIDKNEAIRRLRYEKPNLQVCFRTARALSVLRFLRSEQVC
ncbi:DUF3990 domain-containing protein [Anaerovibrio sp.]|uniref:DUF3990 domain-containing protein n=1 Tax=Anaerovibrio sp. TaxID=1872532 RepID=UPI003F149DC0